MRLSDLAKGYKVVNFKDVEVLDMAYDSRKVKKGDLFCALRGRQADGHQFIPEAIDKGAQALLVAEPQPFDVPQIVAEDTRGAMAELARRLFGDPTSQMKIIGITGTNGKTTTAFMVRSLLRFLGHEAALVSTVEHSAGAFWEPPARTTPEAPDLQRLFRKALDQGIWWGVMEVSSHGVAERRINGITFSAGVFTNLGWDHIDYHGSWEAYREAKLDFFRRLGPDAVAAVNADDPSAHLFIQETPAKVVPFSCNGKGELRVKVLAYDFSGQALEIIWRGRKRRARLPLIGLHNAQNLAAALAVLLGLGFDLDELVDGVEFVEGPPGRFEKVWQGRALAIVDYAHTPDALERTLRAARLLTKGKLLVVFGAGGNRDRGKRPEMGRVAEELADAVIITNDNPRWEDPEEIAAEIASGMSREPLVVLDRREAIRKGLEMLEEGDVLVVAGKGHETYQEIKGERIPFSDREVILEEARELGLK